MQKRALITGINGMDGSHLADLLLSKGYIVYGLERRVSQPNRVNTIHLIGNSNFHFIAGDLDDQNSLCRALKESQPDEVYNLAAQSHVGASFSTPENTSNITGLGALRMLEAIRESGRKIKFYQASSSEMFGKVMEVPQSENTPFYPRSPYGVSKQFAHWMTRNYRESYNMFNCTGILFNHESERRGVDFVTRKITQGVAKISLNLQDKIVLGNLDAKRDWGYAPDYVEGMWQMLQQDTPDDYILATGKTYSVRDFVNRAFECIGVVVVWEGSGVNEKGINFETNKVVVEISPEFFRPAEVELLIGDASKANQKLGWHPITSFPELVKKMVRSDREILQKNV